MTIIATLSYSFAVQLGNFAIVSGIMASTVAMHGILGYLLFKEKLNLKQVLLIATIVLVIIFLRIST